MIGNPYDTYKRQSVMTMTTVDMLTTLYDGILKFLAYAEEAFKKNNYQEVNLYLQKAQKILYYLKGNLDHKFEISQELESLYDYFIRETIDINIKKDPSKIKDISEMIIDLKNTYVTADKMSRG